MSNIKSLADDPKDFKHSEKEKQKTNKRLKKTGKRREKKKKWEMVVSASVPLLTYKATESTKTPKEISTKPKTK